MDLILFNGVIITMDADMPRAEAVAVKVGKIVHTGSSVDILKFREENTKVVDLKGRLLIPGFNDSHMHLLNYGASLLKADLVGTSSIEELINRTKAFAENGSIVSDSWIQGRGWNHDYFNEKRFPTRHDLDRISTTHPVCVTRTCGHVSVVNSRALELAGIDRNTPQPEGGHFDVDEKGEPLGIFRENALNLIYGRIPEPSIDDIKRMILAACEKAAQEGITSCQTDDLESVPVKDFERVIDAYRELEREGRLTVRIDEQCLLPRMDRLDNFLKRGYRTGQGSSFFKIGPLKLLTDGSLGARTAYLSKPYADDPSTQGICVYTQEELDELVIKAHKNNMQVAIHCIGDKSMHMAFDSMEKAQKQYPRSNTRHSIIHCQITDNELLDEFRDLDVIAHIQPIFLDYDLHIVEDRVGEELAKTSYNWKSMLDRNIHVACGSDCPVEYFNVLKGIYCAVTRKDMKGNPKDGWLPDQKLTVMEALHGFTLGAAYASFEENIKGSITPGKLGDMTVLSQNIFEIHPDDIKDVKVDMTIMNGQIIYDRQQ